MSKTEKNFTPLSAKPPPNSLRINQKVFFFLASAFFFLSFLLFAFNVVIPNLIFLSSPRTKADQPLPTSYQRQYSNLYQINFIPKSVNNIPIDGPKITSFYQSLYPGINENQITSLVNRRIFTFLALDENEAKNHLLDFQGNLFEQKLNDLITNHKQKEMKISFYFFKVRFEGTTKENQLKLNLQGSTLKEKAREKIREYHQLNLPPDQLMNRINKDQTILLLNNFENPSEFIEDYDYTTPIFDDPSFYSFLLETPVNEKTPILNLKTKNPHETQPKEYMYIFFYPVSKIGALPGLEFMINNYISKSEIF